MVIVADPQLTDEYSYPSRPGWILKPTEWLSDLFMWRNYLNLMNILKPDSVLFLGDLMDGGREWPDDM
jgi:hypothetical protein